jgi:hypothetical protein
MTAVVHHYPHVVQGATSYCQSGTTASGRQTRLGGIAKNDLGLFTWIELRHAVFGRRRFQVLDRIGWGSSMDFYAPSCSAATNFGRRRVRFRILPHGLRSR